MSVCQVLQVSYTLFFLIIFLHNSHYFSQKNKSSKNCSRYFLVDFVLNFLYNIYRGKRENETFPLRSTLSYYLFSSSFIFLIISSLSSVFLMIPSIDVSNNLRTFSNCSSVIPSSIFLSFLNFKIYSIFTLATLFIISI